MSSGLGGTSGSAGTGAGAAGAAGDTGGAVIADASSRGNSSGLDAAVTGCTGRPGARRGKSNQTVTVGGAARTFVYYAPMGLDANTPAPLVIVPHGSTMSGQEMFDITQYSALADREKFIAIFPDGEGGAGALAPWNVGSGVCGAGALVGASGNDQAFVDALIQFADQDLCVDHEHVFMTGFSMGGYFSHETGCLRPTIRAVAPHSGGTHDLSNCASKHKPVIIFHFKSDALISYSCATDARDKWVSHNGCTAAGPDVVAVKGGSCEYYKGCPLDGQVALCSFDEPQGGDGESPTGHAWSGGSKAGTGAFAAISVTESATELGWAFFKKYAW
jgi:polyhydroxybutyrate depolymerase